MGNCTSIGHQERVTAKGPVKRAQQQGRAEVSYLQEARARPQPHPIVSTSGADLRLLPPGYVPLPVDRFLSHRARERQLAALARVKAHQERQAQDPRWAFCLRRAHQLWIEVLEAG
jgi:hypothetical protein